MTPVIKEKYVELNSKKKIRVVETNTHSEELVAKKILSSSDVAMDKRAKEATKAAISKAKVCNKPVAKYDVSKKKAYIERPDGGRDYIE